MRQLTKCRDCVYTAAHWDFGIQFSEREQPMNDLPQVSILTAERFAELVGLPTGVVEAQLDRRTLPTIKFGKRRFVNLEALRERAKSEALASKGKQNRN